LGTAAEDSEEFVKLYKNLLQDNRSFMIFHKIRRSEVSHNALTCEVPPIQSGAVAPDNLRSSLKLLLEGRLHRVDLK
jgi:hypothetical protein